MDAIQLNQQLLDSCAAISLLLTRGWLFDEQGRQAIRELIEEMERDVNAVEFFHLV